ncbi:unnamed protein product [Effrenium voratum]|nr:unnamed protein product [Effrenium voratum]
MKKEALAQQSPPPSPPSPLSPRIQLDVSGESGDELSEMAGITKPRVGHRAFGSLSASPLQLGPRSPPDSPASSSLSPLSPSSPLSPTSRRERSVHSSNTVLPSFLEREVARAARRHDDRASEAGSVASEEAHADDVKEARLNLRSALIAERKELAGQLGFSRTAQVLVDRLERTIRDLGRRGKSQADPRSPQAPHLSPSGSSTSFLSPLSPHKSPSGFSRDFSFHLGRNDTTLSSQLSGGLSGQLSGGLSGQLSGSVEVAAEAEPEDEDYDSNDEEAMQTRYKERCSAQVITKLRNTLAEEGLLIPKEPEDEKEKQYHEKQVKQEVSSYQEIIASRLARLGAKQSAPLRPSSNPSEAVKEGLLRYHGACEKLGKLYAFEPQATASDPAYEQRQISRFVRDLS